MLHLIGDLACGGAQRQLALLTGGLDPEEFRSEVLSWRDEEDRHGMRPALGEGVLQTHIPRGPSSAKWLGRAAIVLREDPPALLHCWLNSASFWGIALAPLAGVRHVVTSELVSRTSRARMAIHRLGRAALTDSRAVFERLPPEKRVLVPPAVGPAIEGPAAALEGRVVLCVGSLQPDKAQATLLEHARRTPTDQVVLVGRDEDPEYARVLRRTAPANATFVGEESDVTPFYRRADVVVLASRTESAPNVLLEAMAYGRPVVATAVGDVPEILDHGRLGHLVQPGDRTGLSKAIAAPLPGGGGPRWVAERYGVAAMVDAVASVYRRITAGDTRSDEAGPGG